MLNTVLPLAILLPLGAGGLLLAHPLEDRRRREGYVLAATLLTSLLAALLLLFPPAGRLEVLSLHPALSLAFRVDGLSRPFLAILAILWPLAALYAFEYMSHEERESSFFGWYTMTYGVVLGVATAANTFTLYLFYELLTLITLPLVMHGMDGKARWAGKTYLLYSMAGAALAFCALVLLAQYGSLDFVYGGSLPPGLGTEERERLTIAFLLALFGFGVKAALFPGCRWLPAASVAPTPVSALLHAVAVVNSGVFAVLRVTYYNFGPELLRGSWAQDVMMAAAAFTVALGSLLAWREQHLKRRLAWSTVSNLSYILLAASALSEEGLRAALMHMEAHSIFKILLFFCAGAILCRSGRTCGGELAGLGRRMPVTFAAFTVAALGLMGLPPLAGFRSKWAIAQALLGAGRPLGLLGLLALVVSACMTGLYLVPLLLTAFFPTREEEDLLLVNETVTEVGWRMKGSLIPLTLLALVLWPLL